MVKTWKYYTQSEGFSILLYILPTFPYPTYTVGAVTTGEKLSWFPTEHGNH